jgi:hypothetical protein
MNSKKEKYLNADFNLFMVHIPFKSNNNVFICQIEEIGEILKKYNKFKQGAKITMFCNLKLNFKRVTKKELKKLASWDTETSEELKRINLI